MRTSQCDELAQMIERLSINADRQAELSQIARANARGNQDIRDLTLEATWPEDCVLAAGRDEEQDEADTEACLCVVTAMTSDELGELATMVENALSLEYRNELRLAVYLAVTQRQVQWEGYENTPEAIVKLGRETWLTRIRRHWYDYPAVAAICTDLFDLVEEMTPA